MLLGLLLYLVYLVKSIMLGNSLHIMNFLEPLVSVINKICFMHVLKCIGIGWGFENPCIYEKKFFNVSYVN